MSVEPFLKAYHVRYPQSPDPVLDFTLFSGEDGAVVCKYWPEPNVWTVWGCHRNAFCGFEDAEDDSALSAALRKLLARASWPAGFIEQVESWACKFEAEGL